MLASILFSTALQLLTGSVVVGVEIGHSAETSSRDPPSWPPPNWIPLNLLPPAWNPPRWPPEQMCEIEKILGPRLSQGAKVVLPDSTSFRALEIRASSPRISPSYTAIVEPATEEDVQRTIEFANWCRTPFLVVGGAHGWQSTLNNATGSIQINMNNMREIKLSGDGKSVTLGGGVKQKYTVETLYAQGKQVVSGLCECTSIIGPLMGGGHSALQGFYGFPSDNLISARVVLGDGRAVTASSEENPDLFWAMKGAGHNFGVVTSFVMKAHDIPTQKWTVVTVIYTQDKFEDFVDALNDVDDQGNHAPELVLAGAVTHIAAIDANNPVVAYQLSYLGTKEGVQPYVNRFKQAGPVSVTYDENVEYKDYYTATNNGANQTTCQKNNNIFGYSISLHKYNPSAMRTVYNQFAELTSDIRFNTSVWLLESYGSRGVWAQDYSVSAVPAAERNLPILTVPIMWWAGDDADTRQKADHYGKLMRDTLAAGEGVADDKAHIYLNYATGDERLEQIYGDADLVRKLQDLKRKYDPLNSFRFYMPLL